MAFVALEKLSQLQDGYQKAFRVGRLNLLLLQVEGRAFLIENRCPHMDVPLEHAAQLPGSRIRCRAHGIEFDLVSGRAGGPLANQLECLRRFPLSYDGNEIGVDTDSL